MNVPPVGTRPFIPALQSSGPVPLVSGRAGVGASTEAVSAAVGAAVGAAVNGAINAALDTAAAVNPPPPGTGMTVNRVV